MGSATTGAPLPRHFHPRVSLLPRSRPWSVRPARGLASRRPPRPPQRPWALSGSRACPAGAAHGSPDACGARPRLPRFPGRRWAPSPDRAGPASRPDPPHGTRRLHESRRPRAAATRAGAGPQTPAGRSRTVHAVSDAAPAAAGLCAPRTHTCCGRPLPGQAPRVVPAMRGTSRSGQRSRRHAVAQAAPRAGASESAGKHVAPRASSAVFSGVRCGSRLRRAPRSARSRPRLVPPRPAPVCPGHVNARDPESETEEARGLPPTEDAGQPLPATPDAAASPGSAAGLDPGGGRCPRLREAAPRVPAGKSRSPPSGRTRSPARASRASEPDDEMMGLPSAPEGPRAPADTVRPGQAPARPHSAERRTRILLRRESAARPARKPSGSEARDQRRGEAGRARASGDPWPVRLREASSRSPKTRPASG